MEPEASKQSSNKPSAPTGPLGYMPGLDGLRALAVLAVVLYHADFGFLPGGFLGVEIFFVISGYLITSLLLAEQRQRGAVSLRHFWQRRARRLLPAVFTLIGVVLAIAVFFLPEEVARLRNDAAAAFAYITNWYLIFAQQSYFEAVGRPSLLQHLWSLAVEEQFYLFLPLLFVLILGRLPARRAFALAAAGALASAAWMAMLFVPDTDPSRIYYGTDTRAAGLLIGVALAFVWSPWAQSDHGARRFRHVALDVGGVLALGGLVIACAMLGEFDPLLYQGGLLGVALLTAVVIAVVVHPHSQLGARALAMPLLVWIGVRSYSIYLWHWPVMMVTRPQLDVPFDGVGLFALRLGATLALAELSYRLVETPIRRGALGRAWQAMGAAQGWHKRRLQLGWAAATTALAVGVFALGTVVWNAAPPAPPDFALAIDAEEVDTIALALGEDAAAAFENGADQDAGDVTSLVSGSMIAAGEDELAEASLDAGEMFLTDIRPDTTAAMQSELQMDAWLRARANQPQPFDIEQLRLSELAARAPRPEPSVRDLEQLALLPLNATTDLFAVQADAPPAKPPPVVVQPAPALKNTAPVVKQTGKYATSTAEILPARTTPAPVVAIGDSVMLGAARTLFKSMDIDVDAALGRQVSAAIRLMRERQANGTLGQAVVIHLGSNGTFSAKQLDEMMQVLAEVPRVVFVNIKAPRKWQDLNNKVLADAAARYPNVVLVDWNAASSAHPEWFWKDGIHVRPEGAAVYTALIAAALQE